MAEFLDKGFQGASLRQIVKNAGVTTGAFYGYFSSKEALFASIVEPHAAALMGKFMAAQTSFAELPEEQQPEHMGVAVKGIEFGTGFGFAGLRGSEANDAFRMTAEGAVVTATNHNAGINGGIANGMPVVFRTAVKPTPSIYKQHV